MWAMVAVAYALVWYVVLSNDWYSQAFRWCAIVVLSVGSLFLFSRLMYGGF